ncbi:hypothetical protein OE88DRAFT_1177880 [Heliocybe sulcata]|uniref:Chromo domain-containing protein n=1 Tax=Heliocybe sulcata TaxID=5364 RepID=A0A5C3NBM2_9AGAM|nr:hypothetical protein OE88DRAFT_1177880 [Heliocybe sulcata]
MAAPTHDAPRPRKPRKESVEIEGRVLPVSPVLDALFYWMAERDAIRRRKAAGEAAPWTNDPILAEYKFTNVFRVFDRTSQYVLRNVINRGSQDLYETCFRVMLFRSFNRISTWELLDSELDLTWANFNYNAYRRVLQEGDVDGAIYGHAYILIAPNAYGGRKSYENHLGLLQHMLEDGLPEKLVNAACMKEAESIVSSYKGMGPFLSFQLLLDLNMTPHFQFSEDEWAICGPGAAEGLQKIFGCGVKGIELEVMKYLRDTQYKHWERLGITDLPRLHDGRLGIALVDLEHSLCECEKYARVKYPRISGKRKTYKRLYLATELPLDLVLPEKWTPRGGTSGTPISISHLPDNEPLTELEDSDPEYEISHIVREALIPEGGMEYLVRWVGWTPEWDLWLAESELRDAPEVLKDWSERRNKRKRRPKKNW